MSQLMPGPVTGKKIKANNYYLNSPTSSLLLQELLCTNMIEPNYNHKGKGCYI